MLIDKWICFSICMSILVPLCKKQLNRKSINVCKYDHLTLAGMVAFSFCSYLIFKNFGMIFFYSRLLYSQLSSIVF